MSDNRKTEIIDNRKNEIIDDRKTEIISAVENKDNSFDKELIRSKIDAGDIVNGYLVKELISEISGEADIHICEKNGIDYVIKIYKKGREINVSLLKRIMERNSQFLVTPLEIGIFKERTYEIQRYYKRGTLDKYIGSLDIDFIKKTIVKELNEAINTVHEIGDVHNDVKPHNVFLTNDERHLVLGDFGISQGLDGRTFVTKATNAYTHLYAAPEAGEITSKAVDYYAFGMTLLHLVYEKLFTGISNQNVRKSKLHYGVNIPKEVDENLADLIYGLINYDPKKRFGYEEVNAWLLNNEIYKGQRNKFVTVEDDVVVDKYMFSFKGTRKAYYSSHELAHDMLLDLNTSLKHFENDLVTSAFKKIDQDFELDLKEFYENYVESNPLKGLYLTLYKIGPKTPIIINEIKYDSVIDLINDLKNEKTNFNDYGILTDLDVARVMFNNEREEIRDAILNIISETKDKKNIIPLLINTFSKDEKVYYDNKIYNNLDEFIKVFFKGFNEQKISLLDEDKFYEILESNFNLLIPDYIKESNNFTKNIYISYLVAGEFPFIINGYHVKTVNHLVNLLIKRIDNNEKFDDIDNFIKTNRFYVMNNIEKAISEENISEMKESSDQTYFLYYAFSKNKLYLGVNSVEELVKKLETSNNLTNLSNQIYNDSRFKVWLKAKGYQI